MAGGANVTFVDVDGQGAIHHRQLRSAHGSTEKCTNKHESEPAHTISSCEPRNCSINTHHEHRPRPPPHCPVNFLPPPPSAPLPPPSPFPPPPRAFETASH